MSKILTKTLMPDDTGLKDAAGILASGGILAFPTETVYGLGADATNDAAIARIYSAKKRPKFNPLIVHFSDLAMVKNHVFWPESAEILARAFWPGAITFVLKKRAKSPLSRLLSAGLPSIAVRIPDHPIADRLISIFNGPIAAPSANPAGKISSTSAEHVLNGLAGNIGGIIDGGKCKLGLESTIVDLTKHPTLLRPGSITVKAVQRVLGEKLISGQTKNVVKAPGQLSSHYAPRASVRLNATDKMDGEVLLGFGQMDCDLNLSLTSDLTEAASNLFAYLHLLDNGRNTQIAVATIPATGLGLAINDRLERAAAPRN